MKASIKAMRVHRDLSVPEAAKMLGVNPSTLRNWEAGRTTPDVKQLDAILSLYHCDLTDIILPIKLAES